MTDLVLVEWNDPTSHDDWTDIADVKKFKLGTLYSVGWLHEDNGYYTIFPHVNMTNDDKQTFGCITIPKASVLKVTKLKAPKHIKVDI